MEKFSLEPYRKLLNDKYAAPCDIALLTLYGDLASRGELTRAGSGIIRRVPDMFIIRIIADSITGGLPSAAKIQIFCFLR